MAQNGSVGGKQEGTVSDGTKAIRGGIPLVFPIFGLCSDGESTVCHNMGPRPNNFVKSMEMAGSRTEADRWTTYRALFRGSGFEILVVKHKSATVARHCS